MEVDAADIPRHLVEADIIETLETGTRDLTYAMVGNQEGFLPTHEDVFSLGTVLVVKVGFLGLLRQRTPGGEASPMLHIRLVIRTPGLVASLEGVLWSNYFTLEICGQCRMVVGKTCNELFKDHWKPRQFWALNTFNAQIAAQLRLVHINTLDLDLNLVILTVGLLGALEFASSAKKGRGKIRNHLQKSQPR